MSESHRDLVVRRLQDAVSSRSPIVLRVGHDRKEGDPGVLRRWSSSAAPSTVSPRGGAWLIELDRDSDISPVIAIHP